MLLINGLTKGNWMEALVFAIAVAVGMTPEMLPMVITVNLTKGALAMARKRVIVKRLASIQNLGAMDVLATDKTGTLTQDRVLLERHVDIFGHESRRVLEFACLNSFFQSGLRNLLDEAVLTHAELHSDIRSGVGYVKVDEIPFDFERRRMSVVVGTADGARHYLICKGAVEEVIAVCDRAERNGVGVPIEKGHEDELRAVTRELLRGRLPGDRRRVQGAAAGTGDLRGRPTKPASRCWATSRSSIRRRRRPRSRWRRCAMRAWQ